MRQARSVLTRPTETKPRPFLHFARPRSKVRPTCSHPTRCQSIQSPAAPPSGWRYRKRCRGWRHREWRSRTPKSPASRTCHSTCHWGHSTSTWPWPVDAFRWTGRRSGYSRRRWPAARGLGRQRPRLGLLLASWRWLVRVHTGFEWNEAAIATLLFKENGDPRQTDKPRTTKTCTKPAARCTFFPGSPFLLYPRPTNSGIAICQTSTSFAWFFYSHVLPKNRRSGNLGGFLAVFPFPEPSL